MATSFRTAGSCSLWVELIEKTDSAPIFPPNPVEVTEEISYPQYVSFAEYLENCRYTNCALSSSAGALAGCRISVVWNPFRSVDRKIPTLSQFQAADYDLLRMRPLYDFNEIFSSGMVSLLNKSNAIYQLLGQLMSAGTACPLCAD